MNAMLLGMIGALLLSQPALAQPSKALKPQEQKMAECARQAKGLKGEAFNRARNECLRGAEAARKETRRANSTARQNRMSQCSAKAKGLKGDAYRKARDECLRSGVAEERRSGSPRR